MFADGQTKEKARPFFFKILQARIFVLFLQAYSIKLGFLFHEQHLTHKTTGQVRCMSENSSQ